MGTNDDGCVQIQGRCRFDPRSKLAIRLNLRRIGKDTLAFDSWNGGADDTAIGPDGWIVSCSHRAAVVFR